MSALPPDQFRAMQATAQYSARPIASLTDRWQKLHAQAEELAHLASLASEAPGQNLEPVPSQLTQISEWQCELVRQGLEDIDAIMQPGMVALKTIVARGQDATAPALALWREFHAAREAVLAVMAEPAKRMAVKAA